MNRRMFIPASILLRIERNAKFLLVLCAGGIAAACLYPFDFVNSNHVTEESGKGVYFSDPSIAYSTDAVMKLAAVERFTLSLHIMPRYQPRNPNIGQIIGSGLNDRLFNFALRQKWKDLCFMIGADSQDIPQCRLLIENVFWKPESVWVDIEYDGTVLRSYINGIARDSAVYDIPLHWVASYPIVAGNSADLQYPWSGRLDTFALFSQVLPADGRCGGWRNDDWARPLLLYNSLDYKGAVIRDGGIGGPVDLFVPEHYRPYRYIFLEFFPSFFPYDIVVNIIGFIPLGFFISLLIRRSQLSTAKRLILIVTLGFLLSLAMELLQAYLPTRDSGIADILSNSVGTIPGYFLCRILYRELI